MDHVEECPSYYVDCWGTICDCDYSHICMCRELRACEQRMLAAAREAVDALLAYDSPYGPLIRTMAVLAAIDALRKP